MRPSTSIGSAATLRPQGARRKLLRALSCALVAPALVHARPTVYTLGINAGVSFNETEEQQRSRYAPLLDELGRSLAVRVDFATVYSDRVTQALAADAHDLLLIHTHLAVRAERESGHRVLALSDDRKDNALRFFVRPDSPLRELRQLAGMEIGAPGLHSWVTATARATLRAAMPQREVRFRTTRLQEVVPYMVSMRRVDVGVCRSKSVVDEAEAKGLVRTLHVGEPLPLYALIASPRLPAAVAERLTAAIGGLSDSAAFAATPLRGLHHQPTVVARLGGFFLA